MWGRLFAASWPPLVALGAAGVVFLVVLRTSPTGLSSLPEVLFGSGRGERALLAAYGTGAAAALAVATLLVVAPLLVAVDALARRWRKRS